MLNVLKDKEKVLYSRVLLSGLISESKWKRIDRRLIFDTFSLLDIPDVYFDLLGLPTVESFRRCYGKKVVAFGL